MNEREYLQLISTMNHEERLEIVHNRNTYEVEALIKDSEKFKPHEQELEIRIRIWEGETNDEIADNLESGKSHKRGLMFKIKLNPSDLKIIEEAAPFYIIEISKDDIVSAAIQRKFDNLTDWKIKPHEEDNYQLNHQMACRLMGEARNYLSLAAYLSGSKSFSKVFSLLDLVQEFMEE